MADILNNQTCTKCKRDLPISEFYLRSDALKKSSSVKKYVSHCKSCRYESFREHLENTPNAQDKIRTRGQAWRARNLSKEALIRKRNTQRIKAEIIREYGGKCECCGETTAQFLAIDHIYGGGKEHRAKVKASGGWSFYRWLKRHGFPKDDFRLLCHNCNHSRGVFGFCPHESAALIGTY